MSQTVFGVKTTKDEANEQSWYDCQRLMMLNAGSNQKVEARQKPAFVAFNKMNTAYCQTGSRRMKK